MDWASLRNGGIYRFKDREYQAMELSNGEHVWRAWGLMGVPFQGLRTDINYLRPEGTIINVDFQSIGTIHDLEDTGRTHVE